MVTGEKNMKSNMWKSTFREIKQSFGRFMAIFGIVALGVSLFSGLKILQPAMIETTDEYLKEKEFYNYRLLSTLGFEQEDVEFLASQEDVRAAEGAVTFDVLCMAGDDNETVMKAYNLPEYINGIELTAGRMPEAANECLVDSKVFGESYLGEKIVLSEDNEEDDLEKFAYREYTIVGIAQSSNYIQFERGNTSLGSGRITAFLYLPMEGFDVDYFTEILIKFDEDYTIYSDEYETFMDAREARWEDLAKEAADKRYDRVLTEAEEELADAKQEYEEEKAKAEKELEDARIELADAKAELEDGEAKLADAKKELADGRATLEESRETLLKAEYELGYNKKQLESAQEEIDDNRNEVYGQTSVLDEGREQLEAGQAELDLQKAPIEAAQEQLQAGKQQIDALEENVTVLEGSMLPEQLNGTIPLAAEQEMALSQLEAGVDTVLLQMQGEAAEEGTGTMPGLTPEQRIALMKGKLAGIQGAFAEQEAVLADAFAQIDAAQAEIDANRAVLDAGAEQLSSAGKQLDAAQKEVDAGNEQIEEAMPQLADGWTEFSKGEAELLEGEAEIADAEAELADGWKEYYDGYAEYEEGYQEFLEETAEAEAEIADAEAEIADIKEPEVYVLGRETNIGYVCFENDSAIVDGIANVFPVFFYAVAALVCITTMNRMVEEQRTQIGVLKALGYSQAAIMGKYLFYSGAAAITGCIFGYFFGIWFFPKVIWYAYSSMYEVSNILYVFDAKILIFSLVVSMACSMGATYLTCRKELSEVAAELMRPKAPKAGKRVALEHIPFIWKRMRFLHKVSYRNVFRYKKRFFMMVIGISGCTGLLLTGFGIQDSIANVANDQYDRIQIYDVNVMLTDEVTEESKALIQKVTDGRVSEYIFAMEKTIDLQTDNAVKSISLVAIDENEDISPYVVLPDETGNLLDYPGDGECILSHKLANTYGLAVGDKVTLRDENNHTMELTLSGITENYLYNYVYMTTQTYEKYLGEEAAVKSVYLNVEEEVDPHQLTADLMKEDEIASATVSSDSKNRFTSMIESLNLLVVVIIACAAFLAFIVLYNLTNINITERIREIATIKVLGFYKNETASYIFRENLILTFIGAFAGMFLGKVFHAFVMSQVQVDQVAFDVRILPVSYLYSLLLTFVFACVVNLFMSSKLERVSMTESLKSVD